MQMSMNKPEQTMTQNNEKRIKIDVPKMERLLEEDGFLQIEIDHIKDAIQKSSKRIIKSFNRL